MSMLSRPELRALIEAPRQPSVSIYMPTHRIGDTKQDQIRLKNLLREAEARLIGSGLRAAEARTVLEPASRLLTDTLFWQYQADSLAIFASPEVFHSYQPPYTFTELVVSAERFHIKPLLPMFFNDRLFYVLAVSQNQVRLLQCTRNSYWEVTPEEVPASMAEALKYDQREKQHQYHTVGKGPPISHGHGICKDYDKVNILRYFQQIDRGLHEVLREEQAPLVLVAVDYLHPIYREANKYACLLDEGIKGNPDEWSNSELQRRAWSIMESRFRTEQDKALSQYQEAAGRGLTSNVLKEAVLAAYDGRVATLFVAVGVQKWGAFDPAQRKVRLYQKATPGTEDMLDFAAVRTLVKGGTVYALEPGKIPGGTQIAAILRY